MPRSRAITILSWNVESLAPYLAEGTLPEIVRTLGAPEIVALQEVRIRPQDDAMVAAMRRALPGYECHASLCRDPRNVTFRGGRAYGVATYVRTSLRPHALPLCPWDLEGRVAITELPDHALAIVCVYAVNGTSKPYFDHTLGRIEGDRHALKRRFVESVAGEIAALRARGLEVVAIGDWNTSRAEIDTHPRLRTEEPHAGARRAFEARMLGAPEDGGLALHDVFRELRPDARKYTWFDRRAERRGALDAARVDFALISAGLVPRVIDADVIEDRALRHGSDHAPLFVRLRI